MVPWWSPAVKLGAMGHQHVATLDNVSINITFILGTTTMPVHQVLRLGGAIIELDSTEEDAVNVLANDMPIAKGTVVVSGNRIAVEVGELMLRQLDMR
jgi:flagellar motor switch protein FliN